MAELEATQATEATAQDAANEATDTDTAQTEQATDASAELAKLKAEIARQKAALDKATKEAGDAKKALRAKQTAEEQAAEIEKEQKDALQRELEELRKERAVATISRRVITFVQDEAAATSIASAMYGAEDTDAVIDAFNRAWTAREKALKLEYGRVPAPGAGSAEGPTITKAQLDAMTYKDRVGFANAHPDEYNRLMGRS